MEFSKLLDKKLKISHKFLVTCSNATICRRFYIILALGAVYHQI